MKLIYQCEYCDFRGISDAVMLHEQHCKKNPVNIEKKEKLKWIAEHCKYRKECWDEYDDFLGCTKEGDLGRHTQVVVLALIAYSIVKGKIYGKKCKSFFF